MSYQIHQNIAQLVLDYGSQTARELVEARYRSLVDIAREVLADERQQIGISYSGFCLTSLPHKKLADDKIWQRRGHRVTLLVEPGTMRSGDTVVKYGVPFGSRARMILLYLQTQAIRTGSREIELGKSMRSWMERMGIGVGGETSRALKEQASRISACTLKFFWDGEDAESWARGAIVSAGLRLGIVGTTTTKISFGMTGSCSMRRSGTRCEITPCRYRRGRYGSWPTARSPWTSISGSLGDATS